MSEILTLQQFLLFVPAAALIALAPGPNNMLAFRNGMRASARHAAAGVLGRLLAFAGMLTLVIVGLSAVLTTSRAFFEIVKWVGAAYLVAIGLHILWSNRRAATRRETPHPDHDVTDPSTVPPAHRLAVQEFLTAAANPKAMLVFSAFLPQFVHPGGSTGAQLAALGLVYLAVEGIAAAPWIVGGRWLARRRPGRATLRRIERAFGVVFIALGGGLALSSPEPAAARR